MHGIALEGCLFGLIPNEAQTHVQPGEAYVDGNRLRLRHGGSYRHCRADAAHRLAGGVGDGAGELTRRPTPRPYQRH